MGLFRKIMNRISSHGLIFVFWAAIRKYYLAKYKKQFGDQLLVQTTDFCQVNVGTLSMSVPFSPSGLANTLLKFGVHEPLSSEKYISMLLPGEHVLEIGANIGYYALLAYDRIGPSGTIMCLEPVSANFETLCFNIEKYGQIKPFALAAGSKNGQTAFYQSEISNLGSLIHHKATKPKAVEYIDVVRIDDFLMHHTDFCPTAVRMDLEGGEIVVFDGAWNTIRTYKPKLFIEFHIFIVGEEPILRILERLLEIGYDQVTLVDRSFDEPWLPAWVRERKKQDTTIQQILDTSINKIPSNFCLIAEF